MRNYFYIVFQRYALFLVSFFLCLPLAVRGGNVTWHNGGAVTYTLQERYSPVVAEAAALFESDMRALTGRRCHASSQGEVMVYQLDMASNKDFKALEAMRVPVLKFITRNDAFWMGVRGRRIVIVGSNGRGTAYGLMELSRRSGISPWIWWGDVVPQPRQQLTVDEHLDVTEAPSVEYRGINIDDVRWSSKPWAETQLGDRASKDHLGPAYYHKLFELMLRLRANTISAGWDDGTSYFLDVKGNREVADSFDIVVATPHQGNTVVLHDHKKNTHIGVLWADDGYGYMAPVNGAGDKRARHGAALYHLSYQGQPHDCLWLCTTPPGLVCNEMQTACDRGADRLWLVTVHDPKVAAYQLSLFMDMAWNIRSVTPATVSRHLQGWLGTLFGEKVASRLMRPLTTFCRLTGIRRPEFLGWNEAPKRGLKASLSDENKVGNTDFSADEFGNELERYLNDYDKIGLAVLETENFVANELKDAYFAAVAYPVLASAAMATKMLQAQEARHIGRLASFHHDREALEPAARSVLAYREIARLTAVYNHIAEQKWFGLMNMCPRMLPVFSAPLLPDTLSSKEIEKYSHQEPIATPFERDNCIVRNAGEFVEATRGAENVQLVGHSMKAVKLKKGDFLTYQFGADDGDAVLRVALVPTHGSQGRTPAFSVSLDGGAAEVMQAENPLGSEAWKQGVLRGQVVITKPVHLTAGLHRLTIRAVDEPVILDQWMIDDDVDRQFYVFPVR